MHRTLALALLIATLATTSSSSVRPTTRSAFRRAADLLPRSAAYRDSDPLPYQTAMPVAQPLRTPQPQPQPQPAALAPYARAAGARVMPPVGATFCDTMLFPVIGLQAVKVSITTRTTARVQLTGAISLNEMLSYSLNEHGNLDFKLSDHTLRLLHAFGVSLTRAEYCAENDRAVLTVKVPAFPALLLELRRLHPPRRWLKPNPARASAEPAVRDERSTITGGLIRSFRSGFALLRPQRRASSPPVAPPAAPPATQPAAATPLPPVGSTYAHTLTLPMLGVQSFRLSIASGSAAHIAMSGAISLDEPIAYGASARGGMDFKLSDATNKMLKGFGVSLTSAEYCHVTDRAFVTIKPPAFSALRIGLDRVLQSK